MAGFNFDKLGGPPGQTEVDPERLFYSLKPQDPTLNDLWLGQGDALRQWHRERKRSDIAIQLNTGAGKTLVGLLVAQALVNETQGKVVYACASLQLVAQTAQKAKSYGLTTVTYSAEKGFSGTAFDECRAPCITTYQAIFNGRTKKWNDSSAFVFDDAHVATNVIRDQFSLRISRSKHPSVYTVLQNLYHRYVKQTQDDTSFREMMESRDPSGRWLVPPFVIAENKEKISDALAAQKLGADTSTMFAWGHLSGHIDLCAVFLTAVEVIFTPIVIPVRSLQYFSESVRRVYMSATLSATDAFIRTFGAAPQATIRPRTPAGQCERLVLVPGMYPGKQKDTLTVIRAINDRKALIIVPTHRDAKPWGKVAKVAKDDVVDQVETFLTAKAPEKLCLAARFDGIDLPGDTCRVMVIDGLPSGVGVLERFMWEALQIRTLLRSTVASRLVQSFGRISRGLSDHGVVLITGNSLVSWLLTPKNREALPGFLRRQVELGMEISREAKPSQYPDLLDACLKQDDGWIRKHQQWVDRNDTDEAPEEDRLVAASKVEVAFGHALWKRDYERACGILQEGERSLFDVSEGLGAWYLMWRGYVTSLLGGKDEADDLYRRARGAHQALPPMRVDLGKVELGEHGAQVRSVAQVFLGPRPIEVLEHTLDQLMKPSSTNQTEQALRDLGMLLGLASSRPDKTADTGPDVLWRQEGGVRGVAWAFELKTAKIDGALLYKKDVMQAVDHVQWVVDNHVVGSVIPLLITDAKARDRRANPAPNLRIASLNQLLEVGRRLLDAYRRIMARSNPMTLQAVILEELRAEKLLWPDLTSQHPGTLVRELPAR